MSKSKLQEMKYQYEVRRLEFLERKMEFYEKTQRRKAYIRLVLGTFLGVIVAVSLRYLFQQEVPAGNRDIIIALVSGLTGAFFGSVINYYFGDSDNHMPSPPSMGDHENQSGGGGEAPSIDDTEEAKKEPPFEDGP